jgi:hypothetical protein
MRNPDFRQQLVVTQGRGEGGGEELVDGDPALATWTYGNYLGPERPSHAAPFGSRIGVRQTAAEGASTADRRGADARGETR